MGSIKAVVLEVTGGNIRNNHFYVREALGFFPKNSIGGRNASETGKPFTVSFGAETVETDIAGDKGILRNRSAVGRFFEREHVEEGDFIVIERESRRLYHIFKSTKRAVKYYL